MTDGQSYRWQKLRERVVEVGIRAIWEAAFPASMSADIP